MITCNTQTAHLYVVCMFLFQKSTKAFNSPSSNQAYFDLDLGLFLSGSIFFPASISALSETMSYFYYYLMNSDFSNDYISFL